MKNHVYSILTFMFFAFIGIGNINAQQVNSKILEVYGDKTQEMVMNDPIRLSFLNDLLDNRIKIMEYALEANDKYPKLSSVALLNKYNPALTRDVVFDPLNFNPLKYNLNFFPKITEIYRIDNTNYLIVIQPQTTKKD